ncbi:MAG: sugar ABC transporter permease [Treponema sp.]|jgi:raffinose/stachyose/melibiose transport system permease protein|nr:sugar ABC transporter permease [Treponema sp.]
MDSFFSNKKAICVFVLPAIIVFSVIVFAPILMSAWYSLLQWNGIGKAEFIGFANYLRLFKDPRMLNALINSMLFVGASVFIQLPISLILALILASSIKGEGLYRTVYFIPVVISTTVIGQLWIKIYNADYGLLNAFLIGVGWENLAQDWLGQRKTALVSVFIPILWQYVGYHMLILYAGAKSISGEIYEAAKIDGSTEIGTAFMITIPLMASVLKVSLTLSIIGALKVFDLIYVLTGGGPFFSTEVPSTFMYTMIFDSFQYGYGSSIAIFIIVECLVLSLAVNRIFGRGKSEASS